MFMGKTYKEYASILVPDQVVIIRGRISARDEGNNLNAYSVEVIEGGADSLSGPLIISIPEAEATREVLEELDRILRLYAGPEEVQVKLHVNGNERFFKLQPKINIGNELLSELKVLLGASAVSF